MKELVIYRCDICGNLICMMENSGVIPECCGTGMTRISANTEDAAVEKHIPVVSRSGANVRILVGDIPHPMTDSHYITHIIMLTDRGAYVRCLKSGDAPEAKFTIHPEEEVINVYSLCNIHGLWKN